MNKHLKAITVDGAVHSGNVRGLKLALRAERRRREGWSVSSVAPKLQGDELAETVAALEKAQPVVTGDLVASGRKVLADRRYAKRLREAGVSEAAADVAAFRLVGFDWIGRDYLATIYRAEGRNGHAFTFYHVPWQAAAYGDIDAGLHVVRSN